MTPQPNTAAMNTPPSNDPYKAGDYYLAMIAAPFAAAGYTNDNALLRAQSLLWAANNMRIGAEMAELRDVTRDLSMWPIDALAKNMKRTGKTGQLGKRSVWKHVTAVLGEKETARLREKERLNPGAKLFPPEVWKRILNHQKSRIQKRNRKVAQNAHRPVLEKKP